MVFIRIMHGCIMLRTRPPYERPSSVWLNVRDMRPRATSAGKQPSKACSTGVGSVSRHWLPGDVTWSQLTIQSILHSRYYAEPPSRRPEPLSKPISDVTLANADGQVHTKVACLA